MIVGRAPECARLEALLAGARAGRSGALVLEGEPGIGKTALLEHTAAHAEDFTVLHAVGVQSEARLAFCGNQPAHIRLTNQRSTRLAVRERPGSTTAPNLPADHPGPIPLSP